MDAYVRELNHLRKSDLVSGAESASLLKELESPLLRNGTASSEPQQLVRCGLLFEAQIVRGWHDGKHAALQESAQAAFSCWRGLINLSPEGSVATASTPRQSIGSEALSLELPDEPLRGELPLAFRLAVTSLLIDRTAEARLLMNCFASLDADPDASWRDRAAHDIFSAFVLLSRKANGWEDIRRASEAVDRLRGLQQHHEAGYLDSIPEHAKRAAALELIGLYHLAQVITFTSAYLITGEGSHQKVKAQLDRHATRAMQAFESAPNLAMQSLSVLLLLGCECHIGNSVWTHVAAIPAFREFVEKLASNGVTSPLVELWPAQQEALRRNFLDPYSTAISIQMPTSAGKTLLAKFAILQMKASVTKGRATYIVPTRALVNQVTLDLRRDFRPLGIRVEQAVPAMELDPTENSLLKSAPDVLVTTPEKFDLLVRDNHPCTQNLALVVVDEAHNLRDGTRGDRLELLLGVIKRDRRDVRFLLLSPFIPNAEELVSWLGESRALAPIQIDWRPSRRIVGIIQKRGKRPRAKLVLETVEAAGNVDVPAGSTVEIGVPRTKDTLGDLSLAAVDSLVWRGTVLVLCYGKASASRQARDLADGRQDRSLSDLHRATIAYIDAEVGSASNLTHCLRRGVTFHHAGMSHETRWLVERLISDRCVDAVFGTTTLAQGVNFPISTVIVQDLRKGQEGRMGFSDLWNIAGRAGRALVDTLGVVGFPAHTADQKAKIESFLAQEAEAIVSQLLEMLHSLSNVSVEFNLLALRDQPHLSSFLRFLSHAARVAGNSSLAEDVEDVLRASLVYSQAEKEGGNTTRNLLALCRKYLKHIAKTPKGILKLADRTGFATPSLNFLMASIRNEHKDFQRAENWLPEALFGDDSSALTRRLQLISEVPEISLGQGSSANFNPETAAEILRDWVRGATLSELKDSHWDKIKTTEPTATRDELADFSTYLFSTLVPQASWGLGALQGCSLAGESGEKEVEVGFVPSMAFFGVQKKEAVWMRMAGVPRIIAERLGEIWRQQKRAEPTSYDDLRGWVSKRSASDWKTVAGATGQITASDMRLLWREFSGEG